MCGIPVSVSVKEHMFLILMKSNFNLSIFSFTDNTSITKTKKS